MRFVVNPGVPVLVAVPDRALCTDRVGRRDGVDSR
jgi:hypothetical protein